MLISPEAYLDGLRHAEYEHLIEEREELIRYLLRYEKMEKTGDHGSAEWTLDPSPEAKYLVYLEYLSGLCALMREKYHDEYVFGAKTLLKEEER